MANARIFLRQRDVILTLCCLPTSVMILQWLFISRRNMQTNKQTNKFSHLLITQSPTQQISPIEPSLCT